MTDSTRIEKLTATPPLGRTLLRAAATARGRSGSQLPERTLVREGVKVDRDALLDYQRVCGFDGSDVLPHTYPHVLGFPLQAELMVRKDFPLAMPGLVHVHNSITVHRRLTADDVLDIAVRADRLQPHRKGRTVELVTEVSVAGEPVWEGRSTYLARGRGASQEATEQAAPSMPTGSPAGVWRLPESLGRRYAAVSGDVNPIHLHALTARAMGFRSAIAHGMWTYARTLAALGARTAEPCTSHVWFRKPVFLPGGVELLVGRSVDGSTVAGLRSKRKPETEHLLLALSA